ncbi:hypothetical protein BS78_04G123800 [Paspalum vaginatum]|nr:hypothetical protein BS78_04G123800 [Paspalum vaginatum]
MEGSEPDTKSTPATKLSSRHVQSAKELASLVKPAPRCSSWRVRQETVNNNLREKSDEDKQEAWDMKTAEVYSINQEKPTAETDVHKIMHSMKRGKRSARQRANNSAPWVHPLGILNSCRNSIGPPRNHLGVYSKMMRTRARTKSLCVIDREAKEKKNVGGGEGDASNADAASSEKSRVESVPKPPCDDDCMAECVEFAVKLLNDEIPIPTEFSEVEEFFKQMMCCQKSKVIAGPSQSSLSRKG